MVLSSPSTEGLPGVSNFYIFKSRLQEYVQKVGLLAPVYETIKEGPSHEPLFRSTVSVNDTRYDSLPGFFNRKAAEQSAAEVALMELTKSGDIDDSISQPVLETGLSKNLLQEYAQKMNYAIPLYQCEKVETNGRTPLFKCMLEIGGIRYIGATAKTKKEAKIRVARTALLALRMNLPGSSSQAAANSQLTVVPCRKEGADRIWKQQEAAKGPKKKKGRFKRFSKKRWQVGSNANRSQADQASLIVGILNDVASFATTSSVAQTG